VHGHKDWRLPARGELKLLFNIRAEIGGFKMTKPRFFSASAHWYWSSTECADNARNIWIVNFTNGGDSCVHTKSGFELSLRVVRAEP
jgi:hypothetical protein